jgi:acyl-CoA synthetase (AMP-forming)/AMP-acid ligase II
VNFWQAFDDLATRFADRVAVEVQRRDGLERRSYRELRALALSRAAWLAEQDLVAGDRCAILAENNAWWCGAWHRVRVRFGEPLRFEAAADYGDSANRLRHAVDEMWIVI